MKENYSLGKCITTPTHRFLEDWPEGSNKYYGYTYYAMFHEDVKQCDCVDKEGYCMGHRMSREKFIDKYCGGVEPPQMRSE